MTSLIASVMGFKGLPIQITVASLGMPAGHEAVPIATLQDAGAEIKLIGASGSHPPAVGGLASAISWIYDHARSFDIVHVEGAWNRLTLGLLPNLFGFSEIPIVVTPHENFTKFDLSTSSRLVGRALKPILSRSWPLLAHGVIFSSKLEMRDSSHLRFEYEFVVPHAVADAHDCSQPPMRDGLAAPKMRFGFLGRFHPKKGLHELLQAFDRLPDDAELFVAGNGVGSYAEQMHRELAAGNSVHWLGWLTDHERPAFFSSVDFLVMPSTYECFGMAAAEAMVAGVPVIVTSGVGVSEIVSRYRCGFVVEPGADSLAEAMRGVMRLTDRDVAELSARTSGARTVFSPRNHARGLLHAYEKIAP